MKAIITLVFALALLQTISADAILSGLPVTFTMSGATTYTPDAGGQLRNGYLLTLGYVGRSWLGV